MKFSKGLALLLIVVLLMGMFAGCTKTTEETKTEDKVATTGETDKEGSKDGDKKEEAAAKQIVRLTTSSDIPTLDANLGIDTATFEVLGNTVEGLFRLDKNDLPENALCASYEMSDDGLSYVFHLRDDSVWNNGEPVTAHDFEYSWKRLANPATGAQYAYIVESAGIKNGTAVLYDGADPETLGIKATDDYTLEVELDMPVPFIKAILTFPTFFPINQKFCEEKGDMFGTTIDNVLFNGPFVLSTWDTEYQYILTKNDMYYDKDRVKLDAVQYRIVKDHNTVINLYEAGEVDYSSLVGETVEMYSEHPHLQTIPQTTVSYLHMNQKREIFSNINARKAFAMAIDKSFIVENILNDGSLIADYIVPYSLSSGPDGKDFRETTGRYNEYDLKEAAEYWAKAKEELGKDELTVEFLTSDSEFMRRVSEYVQGQLQSNLEGLSVVIVQQPVKNLYELEDNGDFDFSFTGWAPDYADPMTFMDLFTTDSGLNVLGYSSDEYDSIIEKTKIGELTKDLATRWTELQRAEKILLEDDAVIIPLYQSGKKVLKNPKVKNLYRHAFAPDFSFMDCYVVE